MLDSTEAVVSGSLSYEERKLVGRCTWGQCPEAAEPDRQLCARHRIRKEKRRRKRLAARRRARRVAGLCAECGKQQSETYRCLICTSKDPARNPTLRGSVGVSTTAAARIAAATRVDVETDPNQRAAGVARARYHGRMKAGAPSAAEREAQDVKSLQWAAVAAHEAAHELAVANGPDFAERPRWERENAKRAALAKADHATRLVDEVLERNKYSVHETRMAPGRRRG